MGLTMLFSGCVKHRPQASEISSEFPDIHFLTLADARKVNVAPVAVRYGEISQADWSTIVSMISRIAEFSDDDRTIYKLNCFGWPTIAVTVSTGGSKEIEFVKTDRVTWRVAHIYMVDP